jgi:hypothetical protein
VTHMFPTYFYYALVFFSSKHDRWDTHLFYKLLDPSSV